MPHFSTMATFPELATIHISVRSKTKKDQLASWGVSPLLLHVSPRAYRLKHDLIRSDDCFRKDRQSLSLSPSAKNRIIKVRALQESRTFQSSLLFSCDRQCLCFSSRILTHSRRQEACAKRYRFRIQCKYEQQSHTESEGLGKSSVTEEKDQKINSHPKKFLSFRLQERVAMLLRYLRKCSPLAIVEAVIAFLRQYARQVKLSTAVGTVLGICYLAVKLAAVPSPVMVPYSDFVRSLQAGTVTSVLFEEGSHKIFYNMHPQTADKWLSKENMADDAQCNLTAVNETSSDEADRGPETHLKEDHISGIGISKKTYPALPNKKENGPSNTPKWQYSTRKVKHDESYLLSLMREHESTYSSAPKPLGASLMIVTITTLVTLWIPLIPLFWLIRRVLSTYSKSSQKWQSRKQDVGFEDVAGVDAAKAELMEIVSCLQGAINFSKLGAKLPKGVLLLGPPGTGKTLLARAVAGEAGVPFFAASASEFVEMFVGRGAARIRDLFEMARKSAPSIIFIDELDAVGGRRGKSFNDERDQTLNQLLTEMDGFESNTAVLVIAATNRPESLDPALCRPGRFSRRVFVVKPDLDGRRKILAIHLRGIPLEEDPELICNMVASITSGFVGADLANVVNEAALLAARQGKEAVTVADMKEAVHRAKYGIGDKSPLPTGIGKEIERLFPWIPSRASRTIQSNNGEQPLGYQALVEN